MTYKRGFIKLNVLDEEFLLVEEVLLLHKFRDSILDLGIGLVRDLSILLGEDITDELGEKRLII